MYIPFSTIVLPIPPTSHFWSQYPLIPSRTILTLLTFHIPALPSIHQQAVYRLHQTKSPFNVTWKYICLYTQPGTEQHSELDSFPPCNVLDIPFPVSCHPPSRPGKKLPHQEISQCYTIESWLIPRLLSDPITPLEIVPRSSTRDERERERKGRAVLHG